MSVWHAELNWRYWATSYLIYCNLEQRTPHRYFCINMQGPQLTPTTIFDVHRAVHRKIFL